MPKITRSMTSTAVLVLLAGCTETGGSFLFPHGMVAAAQRRWLFEVLGLMAIVLVPIFIMTPLFAWRYRRGGSGRYVPTWSFWWPLELLVWGVPLLIFMALAGLVMGAETRLDPYASLPGRSAATLDVEVVALNWKFLFIYPTQHIATVGLLAVPQDTPVRFRLTSDATMQSFLIPALGSQIYAMAGMVTQLHLVADRPGTLAGENTQFNGMHFQDEHFAVQVLAPAAFARWTSDLRDAGRPLDTGAYRLLAADGTAVDARSAFHLPADMLLGFSDVPAHFFEDIVAKYHPGGMQDQMRAGG